MKILKNILLLVLLISVTSCTEYSKVSQKDDWDRAVRVEKDISVMFDDMPIKIKKPITMYEAMAFAIKNNYKQRVELYNEAINEYIDGLNYDNTIMKVNKAGYSNTRFSDNFVVDRLEDKASGKARSTFKEEKETTIAWNSLDFGLSYYQSKIETNQSYIEREKRRKVVHNLLQDVRAGFWKTLVAKRLIPVIDELNEEMTLYVDSIKTDVKVSGEDASKEQLEKQKNLMKAIKNLTSLRRELESSEKELVALMGLHPSTDFKLAGSEEGNFDIPQIKNKLNRIEWLALMSRPELREKDYQKDINIDSLKKRAVSFVPNAELNSIDKYSDNPALYHQTWINSASKQLVNLFGVSKINKEDSLIKEKGNLEDLKRQNISLAILSQVHLAWNSYQSSIEDYQIDKEITDISEKLAQINADASDDMYKNLIDSSDAIYDEVTSSISYARLQEALGRLYVTIGLDALPDDIYLESVRTISRLLESIMTKWDDGYFTMDDAPLAVSVPPKRPAIRLSTNLPDITIEENKEVRFSIPVEVFDEAKLSGEVIYSAGLDDNMPLPQWLFFDDETLTFTGVPTPEFVGDNTIRVYATDEKGNIAWVSFNIVVEETFIPSIYVKGLYDNRRAIVLKKCKGYKCNDSLSVNIEEKVDVLPLESK